jgi:HD-GYP domain-containing protein (c-di-GMP phosphodiesterase class II)
MLSEILEAARRAGSEGRWDEALDRYEKAVPVAVREAGAAALVDIYRSIGDVRRERRSLDLATEAYELSLTIAELNGLRVAACAARVGLAAVARDRGALASAGRLYRAAKVDADDLGQPRLAAEIDEELAALARARGDLHEAVLHHESALSYFDSVGDTLAMAGLLTKLGMAFVEMANWPAAEERLDHALALADRLKIASLLGHIEINRAELFVRSRDAARARACCDRAFELYGRVNSEPGLAVAYKVYGVIHRDSFRADLAEAHLRVAVERARGCGDRLLEAEALGEWALVHLDARRNAEALQSLNRAYRALEARDDRLDRVEVERRFAQLEDNYVRVASSWAEAIEAKDRFTQGHCERVANYAWILGQQAGITGWDLTWLRLGAYLHDVGNSSVPAAVLNKAGALTEEEWAQMRRHTVAGDAIVAALDFPGDLRSVVRSHHERWDGYGYPDRLAGEAIPLGGRIVCLADVYDALTTTRSYRPAYPREEALRIMDGEVGRTFDPELFIQFRTLILGRSPRRTRRIPIFRNRASAA